MEASETPDASRRGRGEGMKAFRAIFALAAAYNLAFGCWAALFPLSFFRLFDLAQPRYPSIWACVGLVVGLYGFAYAAVARRPDCGDVIVWIGLAGKVLGPIGWLRAVWLGELPPRTFPLILANDLVWWFPFLFYLVRRSDLRRTIIVWTAVALHALACVGLLVTSGGNEATGDMAQRAKWVAEHGPLWATVWFLWTASSLSLVGIVVAWAQRLAELSGSVPVLITGGAVCAVGLLFDLAGEIVNIVWLTRENLSVAEFARGTRAYALLGAGVANGLYCVAGLVLSGLSWHVGFLRGAIGLLGFAMWTTGLALTVAAVFDQRQGMVITGGAVMVLFIPWAGCTGWRLRSTSALRGVP